MRAGHASGDTKTALRVAQLEAQLAAQTARVTELEAKMHLLSSPRQADTYSNPTFRVAQYNILAGYLGDNTQPWFMYGIELSQQERDAILSKFYEVCGTLAE